VRVLQSANILNVSSELSARRSERSAPLANFVKQVGGRFSAELGIDFAHGKSSEVFKWLLAAILFGARISGRVAVQTYREFAKEGLLSPDKISRRGWDGLVEVLDRGGYVRYDFKTATPICWKSVEHCGRDTGVT
jgi:hypothetical protein